MLQRRADRVQAVAVSLHRTVPLPEAALVSYISAPRTGAQLTSTVSLDTGTARKLLGQHGAERQGTDGGSARAENCHLPLLHSLNRQRCLVLRQLSVINPRLTARVLPHPFFNKGPPNGYVIIVFMCTYMQNYEYP